MVLKTAHHQYRTHVASVNINNFKMFPFLKIEFHIPYAGMVLCGSPNNPEGCTEYPERQARKEPGIQP